ncbi:MAG: ATP-dependent 6-phosphofructokinase [Planctomycetota bacterium]
MLTQDDLTISTLGERQIPSPLAGIHSGPRRFVEDDRRVLHTIDYVQGALPATLGFEKAGPREQLFFDPAESRAAIVTCGGLCPGLNNVIRNLFYTLHDGYGVPQVFGIRNGYQGLNPEVGKEPFDLRHRDVESIHLHGGTMLGTSRGPQDPRVMVDFLQSLGVNLLFTLGGDGTQRGAHAIAEEVARREAKIAVVGIPKTIDNDIKYCYRTFGFLTAVAEAERVIDRAHIEAVSVDRGVGLVKLMGREAGFIAAAATIASGDVNFTLIPEEPLKLEGEGGFLPRLARRLDARGHAVVVVAEGAGQELFAELGVDKSGNKRLGDIGPLLKEKVTDYFAQEDRQPASVKYFDPSYYIRSAPANAADSLLTEQLSRQACHAALAGKTDMMVSLWHNQTVHVPLSLSTGAVKRLDLDRDLWAAVLATTGQEKW